MFPSSVQQHAQSCTHPTHFQIFPCVDLHGGQGWTTNKCPVMSLTCAQKIDITATLGLWLRTPPISSNCATRYQKLACHPLKQKETQPQIVGRCMSGCLTGRQRGQTDRHSDRQAYRQATDRETDRTDRMQTDRETQNVVLGF